MYKFACYMHFICVICLNIHKGKYGLICSYMQIKIHTMCTQICTKHSQTKYAQNMQWQDCKYGLICSYMQIKMHTMCTQICTKHSQNMHKICSGRTVAP